MRDKFKIYRLAVEPQSISSARVNHYPLGFEEPHVNGWSQVTSCSYIGTQDSQLHLWLRDWRYFTNFSAKAPLKAVGVLYKHPLEFFFEYSWARNITG